MAEGRLRDLYLGQLPVVRDTTHDSDPFAVRVWKERLHQPESWSDPRVIFVNSMSDLFHVDIPPDYVRSIFQVMLGADHHTYQVLTKRPGRAMRFVTANLDLFPSGSVPAHIWMGTSVENQKVAFRVDQLRQLPAEIRFLSCEPLLGPLRLDLTDIQWVIAGGESGAEARPMNPDWPRSVRDQCIDSGVPFFFKQWGGRTPKAGGRELDGQEWNEYPHELKPVPV